MNYLKLVFDNEVRATDGPMDKETIIEFIEKNLGIELLDWQKDLITKLPRFKKEKENENNLL